MNTKAIEINDNDIATNFDKISNNTKEIASNDADIEMKTLEIANNDEDILKITEIIENNENNIVKKFQILLRELLSYTLLLNMPSDHLSCLAASVLLVRLAENAHIAAGFRPYRSI